MRGTEPGRVRKLRRIDSFGEAQMYRSVTESKQFSSRRQKALYRVEGALVALAIFLGLFYLLGWMPF